MTTPERDKAFKAHKAPTRKAKPAAAARPSGAPVSREKLDRAAEERAKSHAAQALKEAADRKARQADEEKEIGGPEGPEPTRYGDWERKGIAYDF